MNKKLDFFNSIPCLSSLPRRSLQKIIYNFEKKKFTHGQLVYKIGQESKYFYIVAKGEFELYKGLAKSEPEE